MTFPLPRLAAGVLALVSAVPAAADDIPSPSQFLGITRRRGPRAGRLRQIASYFRALDAASPRVSVEVARADHAGRGHAHGRDLVRGQHPEPAAAEGGRAQARRSARALRRGGGRAWSSEGRHRPAGHLQHPLDRDRRLPDGDGVGARPGHRATTRRPGAGWTRSCCCSCPRSTPTARSWRRSGTARTSARRTRAAGCPGSTTTTSGTTTTATGSCSRRRRRRPSSRAVYHEWFPQVWLDEHQMGATGPRIFVPPYADPRRHRHPSR